MRYSVSGALKQVLSGSYQIPDSAYKELSGILSDAGLSDNAVESGIITLISYIISNRVRLPITLDDARTEWESTSEPVGFNSLVSNMVRDNVLSLKKVGDVSYLYSTDILDDVLKDFNYVIKSNNKDISLCDGIIESWKYVPDSISRYFLEASGYLSRMNIGILNESVVRSDGLCTVNSVISGVSNYKCTNEDIQKVAEKYLSGIDSVKSVESYIDGDSEIFISLDIDEGVHGVSDIPDALYRFIEEMEVSKA